ncbi:MAG: hypothetical protein KAJ60_08590 [Desulfobulbaceae bacterium]|nr:hypothetical protein [Desulfobulbaceae bacterium]MCK5341116.1 hypothetical protein [Desulfobulbaceae bacterium]MCK5403998.1 hypothetical protein [Desulfobulbaceae bacterium]
MKKITFYRSILCPRCMVVALELEKLQNQNEDLEIENIDVMIEPVRVWKAGVRLIPALHINDKKLSGIYLSPARVRRFISSS